MTAEKDKEAQLRKNIQYQVACEEKAFRIVERLIENPVEQDWFVDSLQFITPSHYQDVVEERAVAKLCGYPICPKPLGKVPTQKYFISTRSNKVYDVEERKNFCNSRCFKASKYIEKQIFTDPVWSRKPQTRRVFELLPLDMKVGKLGDEIQISGVDEIRTEVKKLERLDHYQQSLEQMGETYKTSKDNKNKADTSTDNNEETIRTEATVYTLDKALSEIGIEDNDLGHEMVKQIDDKSKTVIKEKDKNEAVSELIKEKTGTSFLSDSKTKEKKGHSQKREAAQSSQLSKTEYLMRLLDKKKTLLAKMADIQPMTELNSSQPTDEVTNTPSREETAEHREEKDLEIAGNKIEMVDAGKDCDKTVVKEIAVINELEGESIVSGEKQSQRLIEGVCKKIKVKTFNEMKPVSLTVLHVICQSMRSWITQQTADYLKKEVQMSETREDKSQFKKQYNKQYRALVAKVDAQEQEFSDLIGEESLEQDSETRSLAPAPHFEVLREEMEGDQLRVREFMKGSFTYRENKDKGPKVDKTQRDVVLPSVDKYDQMLIRQRIVLNRINKVLPDLLSPLQLTVGDIFSDVRQLTETFNFTRENITFKPTEWTLVTLILLRLLSRKHAKLSTAFESPPAKKFLTVLLNGMKTDIDTLNQQINLLTRV